MEKLIKDAYDIAYKEIEKYGNPSIERFNVSYEKGIEIANKLGADIDIVKIGLVLMDLKLGEAFKKGILKEHVKMSKEAAEKFLINYEITNEQKKKIINCIEAHHGTIEFSCIEAEICANADCYRFIHPRGVLSYLHTLGGRIDDYDKAKAQALVKLEEKAKILTLKEVKEELGPHYEFFSKYLK